MAFWQADECRRTIRAGPLGLFNKETGQGISLPCYFEGLSENKGKDVRTSRHKNPCTGLQIVRASTLSDTSETSFIIS
jgi:hypothetical protein